MNSKATFDGTFFDAPEELEVNSFINWAEKLNVVSDSEKLICLNGISRLKRKLRSEIEFLNSLRFKSSPSSPKSSLISSNLHHLSPLTHVISSTSNITSVLQTFAYDMDTSSISKNDTCDQSEVKSSYLTVDIVRLKSSNFTNIGNSTIWTKVIARNPQSLHLLHAGNGFYGECYVTKQATEYLTCASQNEYNFIRPAVEFHFYSGVTKVLADFITSLGIEVIGKIVPASAETMAKIELIEQMSDTSSNKSNDSEDCVDVNMKNVTLSKCSINDPLNSLLDKSGISFNNDDGSSFSQSSDTVNLDITAIINLISNLTHEGGASFLFKEPLLNEQASFERDNPALKPLKKFLEGKSLIACKTAITELEIILNTVGGETEKKRYEKLKKNIRVVEDDISDRCQRLVLTSKIKPRALTIFGTGDKLRLITVTANEGFVRAAKSQGIEFAVFSTHSRALSELKQKHATPL